MRWFLRILNSLLASALVLMLLVGLKDLPEIVRGTDRGMLNGIVQGDKFAIIFFAGFSVFIASLWLLGNIKRAGQEQKWETIYHDLSGDSGRSWLRNLILLELGLTAIGVLAAYVELTFSSEYSDTQSAVSDNVLMIFMLVWALMFLVSRIGILFLWEPAREIYLGSVLIPLLIAPLSGMSISGPRTYLYEITAYVLSGFILCFIYLTPAREVFRRKKDREK